MPEQDHNRLRVLLAGGGTGGHLFPALAIAQGLRQVDERSDIRFVGSRFGLEARILPEKNEVFYPLNIRGFQRGLGPVAFGRNLLFPWRFLASYQRCRLMIREFNPNVVVGTGGYASGLPLLIAQRRGIPTLIHEQNAYPGITTRHLSKKANVVCLTYKSSAKYLNNSNQVITGNPVNFTDDELPKRRESRKLLGLPARNRVIFILGGSQGSQPLNTHFLANWRTYTERLNLHLFWQTGQAQYKYVSRRIRSNEGVTLVSFVTDMAAAYIAADLVVSRAGAMTLSEITYLGCPSILVPLPSAAADHQTVNARALDKKKAALLVQQSELPSGRLEKEIKKLFENPERLQTMGKRAKEFAQPAATETIVKYILELGAN